MLVPAKPIQTNTKPETLPEWKTPPSPNKQQKKQIVLLVPAQPIQTNTKPETPPEWKPPPAQRNNKKSKLYC